MSELLLPVPTAVELTFSLIIITARSESQREGTEDWIAMYMPDSELMMSHAKQELMSSLRRDPLYWCLPASRSNARGERGSRSQESLCFAYKTLQSRGQSYPIPLVVVYR
jgi:hypothetical protein